MDSHGILASAIVITCVLLADIVVALVLPGGTGAVMRPHHVAAIARSMENTTAIPLAVGARIHVVDEETTIVNAVLPGVDADLPLPRARTQHSLLQAPNSLNGTIQSAKAVSKVRIGSLFRFPGLVVLTWIFRSSEPYTFCRWCNVSATFQ